jgi:transposase
MNLVGRSASDFSSLFAAQRWRMTRQRRQVRGWICGKDPRQYGFDFGLWTRRIVADLVEEKFNHKLSMTAVGRLLAALEITPQKPLRRA